MTRFSHETARVVLVIVVFVSGSGFLTLLGDAARTPTPIDSCTTITEPGEYALTSDLGGRNVRLSQNCLRIAVSDVHLYGRGYSIDGIGISDTTGIAVNGTTVLRNVTLVNVTVTDWNQGIVLKNVTRSTLENVTVRRNAYGITLQNVNQTTIRNCRFSHNLINISRDNAVTNETGRAVDLFTVTSTSREQP